MDANWHCRATFATRDIGNSIRHAWNKKLVMYANYFYKAPCQLLLVMFFCLTEFYCAIVETYNVFWKNAAI